MLYVSTRNSSDTYTAYRALHEAVSPDGGLYVPFHLPTLTREELAALKEQSFAETVAQILNLFFSLNLRESDIENAVGKIPVKLETVGQQLKIAELWHNAEGDSRYLLNRLFGQITQSNSPAAGWAVIAIKIALLFGICNSAGEAMKNFDISVNTDDFSDMSAVCYSKAMGLSVNFMVCVCNENSSMWDLVNKGEFSTGLMPPKYFEVFLYKCFDREQVQRYLDACERRTVYRIDETDQQLLRNNLFAAVVSNERVDAVISSMLSANKYALDANGAFAYGGLQDYRASVGIGNETLILSKQRPITVRE